MEGPPEANWNCKSFAAPASVFPVMSAFNCDSHTARWKKLDPLVIFTLLSVNATDGILPEGASFSTMPAARTVSDGEPDQFAGLSPIDVITLFVISKLSISVPTALMPTGAIGCPDPLLF